LKFKLKITNNAYKNMYKLKFKKVYITDGMMVKPIEATPTKYS